MKLRSIKRGKKGAISLSVSTMVVIVIAVVLLVMALIFVRRIFVGAIYNVDILNEKVKNQINRLFEEEGQKIAFYLPGHTVGVKQGETYGVAFGIRNQEPETANFDYNTEAVESSCPELISQQAAQQWVVLGKSSSVQGVPSGDVAYGLIKIRVPSTAPVGCEVRYNVAARMNNQDYASSIFDVSIKAKGVI